MPTEQAKAEAWDRVVHDDALPNAMQTRRDRRVQPPHARATCCAPYVARYFDDVGGVWDRRSSEVAQTVAVGLFPTWAPAIGPDTVAAADAFLAAAGRPVRPAPAGARGARRRPACLAGARGGRGRPADGSAPGFRGLLARNQRFAGTRCTGQVSAR